MKSDTPLQLNQLHALLLRRAAAARRCIAGSGCFAGRRRIALPWTQGALDTEAPHRW